MSVISRTQSLCLVGTALLSGMLSVTENSARADAPQLQVWPAPAGEELCARFQVKVDDQPVPVLFCRVSAVPLNQVWPGYQRPLDQTEPAGFALWDMAGPVRVEVEVCDPVESVVIRPAALGIQPVVAGNHITFRLERPGPVVVEVNGPHQALHLFASPPEENAPAADSPGVHYFGPGVHRPGRIDVQSNETVYLAGGAVVYGSIQAHGANNIRIAGRGVLDQSTFERGQGGGSIRLLDCTDVTIEGLVLRDPDVWCCSLFGCRRVTMSQLKLVGLWRYNADGIDVCNSQDVVVTDCFVRAFDDALVIKGLKTGHESFDERPVRNVQFRRCVVWCDWGRAMEIGAETCAPEIADVTFEDSDIIRTTHIAMDIQHGDRALIRDIRFQQVRVEIDDRNPTPIYQQERDEKYPADAEERGYCPTLLTIVIQDNHYSRDKTRGNVRNVLFQDIQVMSSHTPRSWFHGYDAEHTVEGVTIRNLRFNQRVVQDQAEANLAIDPYVHDVQIVAGPAGG